MTELDTRHYDRFIAELTDEEMELGEVRMDPYRVAMEWQLGFSDPSGCLFHMLKTIARLGGKEGNSIEREIASLQATLTRLKQLQGLE